MEKICPQTQNAVDAFLDITQRVILPGREKGAEYMTQRANSFLASLNRNVNRTSETSNSGEPPICSGDHNSVPVRSAPGVPPASLLHIDTGTNSASDISK
jgi:hypothetical protein